MEIEVEQLFITGFSDDLIEVTGKFEAEFNWYDEKPCYIAVSDGTMLEAQYDSDGIWRFKIIANGYADYTHNPGYKQYDTNDIVKLTTPQSDKLQWVVLATQKSVIQWESK